MTAEEMLAFEADIASEFEAKRIHAPIHLAGGNERQLIRYFTNHVRTYDWCLCGWRSHYHCLLKGVPPAELKAAIMAGRSVSLCFSKQKILSSGIVGGTSPIGVGLAWSLRRRENGNAYGTPRVHVHVFIGDMTAEAGVVHESMRYAAGHALDITWIIEDNGLSVCTPTRESWGKGANRRDIVRYEYELSRPHAGVGKWVRF